MSVESSIQNAIETYEFMEPLFARTCTGIARGQDTKVLRDEFSDVARRGRITLNDLKRVGHPKTQQFENEFILLEKMSKCLDMLYSAQKERSAKTKSAWLPTRKKSTKGFGSRCHN
jgi:hypothetical protein